MRAQLDFSGRTILITGASSGIGAATARLLARCGAERLLLADLQTEELASEELGCAVQLLAGDVGDPACWDRFEREICELDHAVINAGVGSANPISGTSFGDWRRVMSTNLDGAFLSLRAVIRKIRDGGSIVLTASVSGIKAEPGTAAYAASKAAVIQLAKVAARELAPRGVRVNAIAPGGVDTPIWDAVPFFQQLVASHGGDRSAALSALAAGTPMGKFASADEIAAQIAFLLSDLAGTVTGTTLVSDGGYSL